MKSPLQRLRAGLVTLGVIFLVAVLGYRLAGWSLLDSVYMVVITLSTVGYGEVHPLSPPLKMFTILVVIVGVSTSVYIVGVLVRMMLEGEIEAAVCEAMCRFEQDYMGRGPKDIHTHLLGDLLVVRLRDVLTAAEQQLVESLPAEKGGDLLKQLRTHLIETARPVMEAMVLEITGVKALTLHHDISTATGEEVVLFTLAESPIFRDAKKK